MSVRALELAGLYASERGRLLRLVQRIAGNRATAEDIAHDAFVKLSDRQLGLADRSLLARTAQNLALDHLRAQRVRETYAGSASTDGQMHEVPLPDQVFAARQELQALLSALEALPLRTRQIFLLNRLDGMSHRQIAQALDVSVSTVEKDMVRALTFCRTWQKNRDGD